MEATKLTRATNDNVTPILLGWKILPEIRWVLLVFFKGLKKIFLRPASVGELRDIGRGSLHPTIHMDEIGHQQGRHREDTQEKPFQCHWPILNLEQRTDELGRTTRAETFDGLFMLSENAPY